MSGDITSTTARCRRQDPQAPSDLEKACSRSLREWFRLVRRRRPNTQRARIDSEALVNAALHSFVVGVQHQSFPDLPTGRT